MTIDQLKSFHKVALTGSFTKAARELFLTQPAVSHHIQALERFFGITLFDRSGKKVSPTSEGEILLSYTDRLFNLYEEIETLFGQLQELQKGKITIGSTAVPGTHFLPRIIGRYNREYPGIECDLRMGNSRHVFNMILEREVDLGFAGMITTHPKLTSIHIHRENLLVVSSPHNSLANKKSVSVDDLDQSPFIWREKGTQTRMVFEGWFENKVGRNYPKKSIQLENVEAAKRIVEEGYGITVIPEVAVRKEISAGLLKPIDLEGFDISVDFHLFYLTGKVFSKAAKAFLEMLSSIRLLSHAENLRYHLKELR